MTTRPALPQNYISNEGTLTEDFETFADWSMSANGTIAATTECKTGSSALKLTVTTAASSVYAKKTVNYDLSSFETIEFWVKQPADSDRMAAAVTLGLGNNASLSNRYECSVSLSPIAGWRRIVLRRSDFIGIGSPDWNAAFVASRFQVTAPTAKYCDLIVDNFRINSRTLPNVIISFDDGRASCKAGLDYMASKGLYGTAYIVSDIIGAANRLTLADIQELYADGHAIANHTQTHAYLATMTYAQVEAAVVGCRDYLIANGMPRAASHVAFPGGQRSDTVNQVLADLDFKTGRMVTGSGVAQYTPPINMYQMFTTSEFKNTNSLATMKGYVDAAILRGHTCVLFGHDLAEAAGPEAWTTADFQALIDYILSKGSAIRCCTIDEWYNGLTNPRYQSLPVGRT